MGSMTHWRWLWPVEPCSSPSTASRERTRERVRRMACSTAWSASVTGVRSGLLITCRSRALKRSALIESASSASTWARRRSSVKSMEPDAGPEIGMGLRLWCAEPNSRSIRTMRRDCLRWPSSVVSPALGNGMVGRRPSAPHPGDPRGRGVRPAGGAGALAYVGPAALPRPAALADPGAGGVAVRVDLGGVPHGRRTSSTATGSPTSRARLLDNIETHESYAKTLRWIAIGLRHRDRCGDLLLPRPHRHHPHRPGALVAISAVATLVWVALTGDAGSRAVWS